MTAKKAYTVPASMSFEKALARLDVLTTEMDSGELSLDNMISHFEEGQALIKFCSTKLNEVEKKVEILVRDNEAVDFDSAADGGVASAHRDNEEDSADVF